MNVKKGKKKNEPEPQIIGKIINPILYIKEKIITFKYINNLAL